MAAFIVVLLIVAHRFLRLDLVSGTVAALRPQTLLLGAMAVSLAFGVLTRRIKLRISPLLFIQWALWAWALLTLVVSDGAGSLRDSLTGDYTKDVVFATLIALTVTTVARLRTLAIVFTAVMAIIAAVVIPQHSGPKTCNYAPITSSLSYDQKSDHRPCASAQDCYNVPRSEAHLRDMDWTCEHGGPWELSTVIDRVHYTGNLLDPNALALSLVVAAAFAMMIVLWPRPPTGVAIAGAGTGLGGLGVTAVLRLAALAALPAFAVAVLYAASRAGQLALGLVFFLGLVSRVGWLGVIAAVPMAAPVILISYRNESEAAYSTVTRIMTFLNGYHAFLDHPVFGVGLGNYERFSFLNAHNSFMLALTETGLIGGFLFVLGCYAGVKFLLSIALWPPGTPSLTDEQRYRLSELRHAARMLLGMLLGALLCVFFLSLAFDVMWLFPVGIVAGFYQAVRAELPEYSLRLSVIEIFGLLFVSALLPAALVAVASARFG